MSKVVKMGEFKPEIQHNLLTCPNCDCQFFTVELVEREFQYMCLECPTIVIPHFPDEETEETNVVNIKPKNPK